MSLPSPSRILQTSPLTRSSDAARRVLILGGVRSGKSLLAETLVTQASQSGDVRPHYIATVAGDNTDSAWRNRIVAHQHRRPESWITHEMGANPHGVIDILTNATAQDILLLDDVGGWLTGVFEAEGRWDEPTIADLPGELLAKAISSSPAALVVLVSPEVGLSVISSTESGRTFTDAQGKLNQKLADICEAVAVVIAGRPLWLSGAPTPRLSPTPPLIARGAPSPIGAGDGAVHHPDEAIADAAEDRLHRLDTRGCGLGALTSVVRFAAATQGQPVPQPWHDVRVVLLCGDHEGGAGMGDGSAESGGRLMEAGEEHDILTMLASQANAQIMEVRCPSSRPIEDEDALPPDAVNSAIDEGKTIANRAIDEGADLLVLASRDTGGQICASAITVHLTGGEPFSLLPQAVNTDGVIDDETWMRWCVTVRDALYRVRHRHRDGHTVLGTIGGGDIAVGTGVLLAAAARRTPVIIDGPIGAASALIARDIETHVPCWVLLADDADHPTVKAIATVLGLSPILHLRLGLGEGCGSLISLPVMRTAVTIASVLTHE